MDFPRKVGGSDGMRKYDSRRLPTQKLQNERGYIEGRRDIPLRGQAEKKTKTFAKSQSAEKKKKDQNRDSDRA